MSRWTPRGATAGKFEVKSCGNAHPWCRVCKPDMQQRLSKPKGPPAPSLRACRNCGLCNDCIGLTAPEGMKVCRQCQATKPLDDFPRQPRTGGYRNQCKACRKGDAGITRCSGCNKVYPTWRGRTDVLCNACRNAHNAACPICTTAFNPVNGQRYCSTACARQSLQTARRGKERERRIAALRAYGGSQPACVCCQETQTLFLALDHIDGGGGKHRQETGGGGFYSWLKRNHYPSGFRILCHNCNMGRQLNGGICPHRQE